MANTYSDEAQLLQNAPPQMPNAGISGGRLRRYRNSVTMAAQASADTITCVPVPPGNVFAFGVLNASVTLGSSTLAIGTAASPGLYRAAATFTAAIATMFGLSGPADDLVDADNAVVVPLITIGAAALPASGNLLVDLYFSGN